MLKESWRHSGSLEQKEESEKLAEEWANWLEPEGRKHSRGAGRGREAMEELQGEGRRCRSIIVRRNWLEPNVLAGWLFFSGLITWNVCGIPRCFRLPQSSGFIPFATLPVPSVAVGRGSWALGSAAWGWVISGPCPCFWDSVIWFLSHFVLAAHPSLPRPPGAERVTGWDNLATSILRASKGKVLE